MFVLHLVIELEHASKEVLWVRKVSSSVSHNYFWFQID